MASSRLHELSELGQSVWIDNLSRELLRSGCRILQLGEPGSSRSKLAGRCLGVLVRSSGRIVLRSGAELLVGGGSGVVFVRDGNELVV